MYDIIGLLGRAFTIVGFIATLVSIFAYFRSVYDETYAPMARLAFHVTATSVIVASAALLILILKHQFQFSYVYGYSARDLPFGFLVSTFYAGQEGSFLLWTLMLALIGIVLLTYAQKKGNEPEVMCVYGTIMAFMVLLVVLKNPFARLEVAAIPPDGKGLNPLLQNFWMQIHPPILFLGFAAMAPPFALAIAALVRRQYQEWVASALPWMVFGAGVLGLGIALGGFWAYETLGWGGWWGWDPVENSSLIPWVVGVAAVHTLLTQKKTQGLVITNFLLVILGFVLVIYSTFLTRSGVLGDASVHAFADPGRLVFTFLVLFMFVFVDFGLAMIFARFTKWGGQIWEKYSGWKLVGVLYAVMIVPSIPLFAKVSGDVVPVFQDAISNGSTLASIALQPLLGLAHVLNVLSYLWIPALLVKLGLIVYIFTGRVHSEKDFDSFHMLSRETFLAFGSVVLAFFALIVLLGTSLPIVPKPLLELVNSAIAGLGSSMKLGNTVEPSFYDTMGLPIAIIMTFLTGSTLLFMWRENDARDVLRKSLPGLAFALVVCVVLAVAASVHSAGMLLLAFFSSYTVFTNTRYAARIMRGNWKFTGAQIAHVGLSLMLLGIIGSGYYNKKANLELPRGTAVQAQGYQFTYAGYVPQPDGHDNFLVALADGSGRSIDTVRTVMFMSTYGGQQQLARNPGIERFFTHDVYIEPQALQAPEAGGGKEMSLKKGETVTFENYAVTFTGFAMAGGETENSMTMTGNFTVVRQGGQPQTVTTEQVTGPNGVDVKSGKTTDGDLEITYVGVDVDQKEMSKSAIKVRLANPVSGAAATRNSPEILVVEVSIKPFIGFVWVGIILMVGGFGLAAYRRRREDTIEIEE